VSHQHGLRPAATACSQRHSCTPLLAPLLKYVMSPFGIRTLDHTFTTSRQPVIWSMGFRQRTGRAARHAECPHTTMAPGIGLISPIWPARADGPMPCGMPLSTPSLTMWFWTAEEQCGGWAR